ncbi:TlpA family protein disulfide reductase [Thalassotalea sp. LPB0316]|nr:TlpA family protein disulfide reductase [Thalassotalea sp. LPB0316]
MLSDNSQVSTELVNLPTLDDKTIAITAQQKKKVLYFFAPWCQICHASIGNLENIYLKRDDIDVVAIALDFDSIEEVQTFVADKALTFPVALGNSELKTTFQITGYPSYYVIDENNKVVAQSLGYSTELGLYLRTL